MLLDCRGHSDQFFRRSPAEPQQIRPALISPAHRRQYRPAVTDVIGIFRNHPNSATKRDSAANTFAIGNFDCNKRVLEPHRFAHSLNSALTPAVMKRWEAAHFVDPAGSGSLISPIPSNTRSTVHNILSFIRGSGSTILINELITPLLSPSEH